VVAVPVTLLLWLQGHEILRLVFGARYAEAGGVLAVLALGPCLRALLGVPGVLLQMSGHQVLVMRVTVLVTVLTLAGMAAVVGPFGLLGLAAVASAGLALQSAILTVTVYRLLGIRTYAGALS
jgi:O-antigen/teichoic acid export membrane protein